MSDTISSTAPHFVTARQFLHWSGRAWFTVAAIGQLAFVVFIIAFYYTRTFSGDFAAWNDKALIDGFKEGDIMGNMMFAIHVVLAAVMTVSGLIQLIPQIRSRAPRVHRMSGRVFVLLACLLALGGLWLGWVRGTQLSSISALSVSLNGVLVLAFAVPTVAYAVRRNIALHQRWAMRFFLVASGVWFVRVGIMGWLSIAQGPVGMNASMSGPADIAITFGSYLIPLAIYEAYYRARSSSYDTAKASAATLVLVATLVTAIGVYGTIFNMWLPIL
ncbi:MAG: DUF2306 domain-containing protein [Hyphomonas sp.]|nr:DUF2306 domain-containing protein [Hyphomonas sp.]